MTEHDRKVLANLSALVLLGLVTWFITWLVSALGWGDRLASLDRSHVVAHFIIAVALVYTSVVTIGPLIFFPIYGNAQARRQQTSAGMTGSQLRTLNLPEGLGIVLGGITALVTLAYYFFMTGWERNPGASIFVSQTIVWFFVGGGVAIALIDLSSGDPVRKAVGRTVDSPFAISVLLIAIASHVLCARGVPANYALGVSSGALAVQLVVSNLLAPWGLFFGSVFIR